MGRIRRYAYTLIEVMVVAAIIALVVGLTFPAIRAMQASSARAEAYNTINAALQGARSYAIMHNCLTAARFQPNGKIFLVYRFTGQSRENPAGGTIFSAAMDWGGAWISSETNPFPDIGLGALHDFIFLPVIDRKPLRLPRGYAAFNPTAAAGEAGREPFYVCYRPDGTLAVNEDISVALVDRTAFEPINLDLEYDSALGFSGAWAWPPGIYDLTTWIDYTKDVANLGDVDDQKVSRYYYVATDNDDLEEILFDQDVGPDHYAGYGSTISALTVQSVSEIAVFPTPENWHDLPIYSTSVDDRASFVEDDVLGGTEPYETIFINAYTGRIIRPVK